MQIQNIKIDEIIPYEKNHRKNQKAVPYVKESIKEFGFQQPIVLDKNKVVICGHTRLMAAKELGLKEVPCIIADMLSEEQVNAYRLADNKTNEAAEWNDELLIQELMKVGAIDMELFGFETEVVSLPKEKPEVEFTEVLGEENNYIILKFTNDIDWLQAQSVFGIHQVKAYSTRNDGKISKGMERIGVARVLDGAKVLSELFGGEA